MLRTASLIGLLVLLAVGWQLGQRIFAPAAAPGLAAEARSDGRELATWPLPAAAPENVAAATPPEVTREDVRGHCEMLRRFSSGSEEEQGWYEANCLGAAWPTAPHQPPTHDGEGVLAVGDSVLLGAASQLVALLPGVRIDAVVARSVAGVTEALAQCLSNEPETRAVVVHTGNNGPLTSADIDRILGLSGPQRRVLLINVSAPLPWESANNAIIAAAAASHPNTELLDWHEEAAKRSDLLWGDRIHLRPEGARVYASLVAEWLTSDGQGGGATHVMQTQDGRN